MMGPAAHMHLRAVNCGSARSTADNSQQLADVRDTTSSTASSSMPAGFLRRNPHGDRLLAAGCIESGGRYGDSLS